MTIFKTTIRFAIIGCASLLAGVLPAQNTFQKTYGSGTSPAEASDMLELPDGFLVAGAVGDSADNRDALLLRLDPQGEVIWEKSYGGPGFDEFQAIAMANDGGFMAIGTRPSDSGTNAAWLVKINLDGSIAWQKQFAWPDRTARGFEVLPVEGGYVISVEVFYLPLPQYPGTFGMRLDNAGEVIWSSIFGTSNYTRFRLGYATDSLFYAGGITHNQDATVISINPQTGAVHKAVEHEKQGTSSQEFILPTNDESLLLAHYYRHTNNQSYPWAQRVVPNSIAFRWIKLYNFSLPYPLSTTAANTGGEDFLLCVSSPSTDPNVDAFLMRINKSGEPLWCRVFGKPDGYERLVSVANTSDGGFLAVGYAATGSAGKRQVFVVKTDADGKVAGCCPRNHPVTTFDTPNLKSITAGVVSGFPSAAAAANGGATTPPALPAQWLACNSDQPTFETQISLCPGETTLLGGQAYAAPDTIEFIHPAPTGCDTLQRYILTNEAASQNSQISLQCPANMVATAAANANFTTVHYDSPIANSTCTCPGLELQKVSGGESGSAFPIGTNTVCWQAADVCGSGKTCCFTIEVVGSETACDEKKTACLTWELLSINRDAAKNLVYRIRATNTCASHLVYAYIGIESGITPVFPANNSLYQGPSGREYLVRNPNFSPVYGLRFKAQSQDFTSGQSEIFRFVLPPQINPAFVYVAARLGNQSFYEAHLDTHGCPIGTESGDRAAEPGRNVDEVAIQVFPNPAAPGALLQVEGTLIPAGTFQLFDSAGRRVFSGSVTNNQISLEGQVLPEGLYFFRLLENEGMLGSGALLLQR